MEVDDIIMNHSIFIDICNELLINSEYERELYEEYITCVEDDIRNSNFK